jgi:hypothetical protein
MPLSPDFVRRLDELRHELLVELDGSTRFWFQFDEEQMLDLASGYVPDALKAAFMVALDWHREDERRAARPVKVKPASRRKISA